MITLFTVDDGDGAESMAFIAFQRIKIAVACDKLEIKSSHEIQSFTHVC